MPDCTAPKRDLADLVQTPLASALTPLTVRSHGSMIHMDQSNSIVAAAFNLHDALCSLDDILERIDRSSSWAYENGLVPMFDRQGQRIKSTKIPPWPWEVLPDPIVKIGKKAWITSRFDSWLARMNARVNHAEKAAIHSHQEHTHA